MDTGLKIKHLREEANMTQEELGKILGVKKAAINKYENGTVVNLKRSTIEKLCSLFGVSPQYLLSSGEDARPAAPAALAEDEQELIFLYRELNEEGQEKLLEYADDLVASGKYIKNCSLGMVEA